MIRHSRQLRKGQYREVVDQRRNRLRKLIDINAPEWVVIAEAELYLSSFRWSWRGIWQHFRIHRFPRWLLWLTDADYRAACREEEEDEFDRDMREMFGPQ